MAACAEVAKTFNRIVPSFLWKGQWISAHAWVAFIRTHKDMKDVDIATFNRAMKPVSSAVSSMADTGSTVLVCRHDHRRHKASRGAGQP